MKSSSLTEERPCPASPNSTPPALELCDVRVELPTARGTARIIRGASFTVGSGEIVALAGESGSGKSTAIMAALRLLPPGAVIEGRIAVDGTDVLSLRHAEMRQLRARRARLVFQDPWKALHPMHSIGRQLVESARSADPELSRAAARDLAGDMLSRVGIPDPRARLAAYPHEVSGGQLQRIVIAMALVASPSLLFCDEPTTALDVTTQAQILELIRELNRDLGISIVIASHDLDVIADVTDRLVVMYGGAVVEEGVTAEVLASPRHPYTWSLLQAAPGAQSGDRLRAIDGRPPAPYEDITGCSFAPRCASARAVCREAGPELRTVVPEPPHRSSCLLVEGYGPLPGEAS